jgi:hypothetical protein
MHDNLALAMLVICTLILLVAAFNGFPIFG